MSEIARYGARIRMLRLARQWRVEDLAHFVGVSKQAVSKVELGRSAITVEVLVKYAQAFGVPASLLLGEHPRMVELAKLPLALRRDYILVGEWETEDPDGVAS